MRNTLIYSYLLLILIICSNCANQRPPTGGEKDEDPPELISSVPEDGTLNFKGKQIELQFNEAIKLNSAKEQIIVTPRLQQEYEIKFRKDRVIISFEESLTDSTTYTFNFREAIQDLNEGNPAENLKLSFSTGNYLDSLKLTGSTNNILTNKTIKDVTVSLYPIGDTLNPFEHPPLYFTKTNGKGEFQFDNLKNGNYQIIAVKDKNKNLFIDSKNEFYGFLTDTLQLTSNIDSLYIPLQLLDTRSLELQSSRQAGTIYQIKFNKYVSEYKLVPGDSINLYSNFTNQEQNTIQVYNRQFNYDSLFTQVIAYDTTYQELIDTLYVKFEPTSRSPQKLEHKLIVEPVIPSAGIVSGTIRFNKPIAEINYDSIYIYLDSMNQVHLDSSHLKINNYKDQLTFEYTLDQSLFEEKQDTTATAKAKPDGTPSKPGIKSDTTGAKSPSSPSSQGAKKQATKPFIAFEKNTFISVEQDSSKRLKSNLDFKKLSSFATLLVEVQPKDSISFIVQLLNKNDEVIREAHNQKQINFKQLNPGDYRIRIIVDSNDNGRWDPGFYDQGMMPERIIFFKNSENQETITLRANWEVGPNIIKF